MHGGNGYRIDPGDVSALTGHLASLQKDRDLLSRLSLSALECYRQMPLWGETATNIREFLEKRIS
jgi:hypothetical protein